MAAGGQRGPRVRARAGTRGRSRAARRPPPGDGPRAGTFPTGEVLATLAREAPGWGAPVVAFMGRAGADPFRILVSCLLSLRTRDQVTAAASASLFRRARTPRGLLRLDEDALAALIRPVGFYRTKARTLREVSRLLLERHAGRVPRDLDALLALPGVGRKTANLVVTQAFGDPGICVDTHVHRIPNRWGLLATRTPEESEDALRRLVEPAWWVDLNPLLVAFGQTICQPVSPRCSTCPVAPACARVGVVHSR